MFSIDLQFESVSQLLVTSVLAVIGLVFANIAVTAFVLCYIDWHGGSNKPTAANGNSDDANDDECTSSDTADNNADAEESSSESSHDSVLDIEEEDFNSDDNSFNEEEDLTVVTPDNTVVTLHADGNSTVITPDGTTIAIDEQDGEPVATVITPESKVYANIRVDSDRPAFTDSLADIIESIH